MTDERPRPQYGEYASDAEQASALERSGATVPTPAKSPTPSTVPAPQSSAPDPASRRTARASDALPGGTASRIADRTATVFLLSFGFVYVVGSSISYLNLASALSDLFTQMGIGHYTPTSMTSAVGIGIIVGQAVVWLIVVAWSYRRITTNRTSWWVPLLGVIASVVITAILLGILLAGDPAFIAYSTRA